MHTPPTIIKYWFRYEGWVIASILFACTALTIGVSNYSFGLFIEPLENAFGWQRTAISASLSFLAIGSLIAPILGRIMDNYGTKPVMITSLLLTSISFLLRPLMTELWHWYALSLIQFIAFPGITILPAGRLVGIWFERHRGKAMGMTLMGNNFGGLVMPFVVGFTLSFSWQFAFLVVAGISFGLSLVTLALVHEHPRNSMSSGSQEGITNPILTGWTVNNAIRTKTFYAITSVSLLACFTYSTILPHVSAHLSNEGMSTSLVVKALSLLATGGMVGKLLFGYLADKTSPRLAITITQLGQIMCILLMVVYPTSPSIWVSMPVFGLCMGGYGPVMMLLIQNSFGLKNFGSISGLINLSTVISFGAGPILAGISFDISGHYDAAFVIVAIMFGLSLATLTQVRLPTKKL